LQGRRVRPTCTWVGRTSSWAPPPRRSRLARAPGGGRRILSRRSDPGGRSARWPWITLPTASCGAAAASDPSVAARLC